MVFSHNNSGREPSHCGTSHRDKKCHFCEIEGHIAKDCRKKMREFRNQKHIHSAETHQIIAKPNRETKILETTNEAITGQNNYQNYQIICNKCRKLGHCAQNCRHHNNHRSHCFPTPTTIDCFPTPNYNSNQNTGHRTYAVFDTSPKEDTKHDEDVRYEKVL